MNSDGPAESFVVPQRPAYPDYSEKMDAAGSAREPDPTQGPLDPVARPTAESESPPPHAGTSTSDQPATVEAERGERNSETACLMQELHIRFDRIEESLNSNHGIVERNYEQSLIALRDRAEVAESGISRNLLQPLARRIAAAIDRAELELTKRQAEPWALVASMVDELHDVLDDFGVSTISPEPGMAVDRAQHRVVRSVSERVNSEDSLRVVECIRHGYTLSGSGYVIRPAEVIAVWEPAVTQNFSG
jgi:molecular chaperone GrpE (heat shock protein)